MTDSQPSTALNPSINVSRMCGNLPIEERRVSPSANPPYKDALVRLCELRAEVLGDQHVPLQISCPNVERCHTENCLGRGRQSKKDQGVKGDCPHNPSRIREHADREIAKRGQQRVRYRKDVERDERKGRDACQQTKNDICAAMQIQLHSASPEVLLSA